MAFSTFFCTVFLSSLLETFLTTVVSISNGVYSGGTTFIRVVMRPRNRRNLKTAWRRAAVGVGSGVLDSFGTMITLMICSLGNTFGLAVTSIKVLVRET